MSNLRIDRPSSNLYPNLKVSHAKNASNQISPENPRNLDISNCMAAQWQGDNTNINKKHKKHEKSNASAFESKKSVSTKKHSKTKTEKKIDYEDTFRQLTSLAEDQDKIRKKLLKTIEKGFNSNAMTPALKQQVFQAALSGDCPLNLKKCDLNGLSDTSLEDTKKVAEIFVGSYARNPKSDESKKLKKALQSLYQNPSLDNETKEVIKKCAVLLQMAGKKDALPEVLLNASSSEEKVEDYQSLIRQGKKIQRRESLESGEARFFRQEKHLKQKFDKLATKHPKAFKKLEKLKEKNDPRYIQYSDKITDAFIKDDKETLKAQFKELLQIDFKKEKALELEKNETQIDVPVKKQETENITKN